MLGYDAFRVEMHEILNICNIMNTYAYIVYLWFIGLPIFITDPEPVSVNFFGNFIAVYASIKDKMMI